MSIWVRAAAVALSSITTIAALAQSSPYQTPASLIPEAHETPRPPAPLFFREIWRVTPGIPLLHPAGQKDVSSPNLELRLYGPSGKDILMNGAPDLPNNPMHLWTGMCQQPCAAALRDKNNYVDLTGWGKIRWVTREGGFHQLRAIIKLADGTWLVSEHADAVGLDHHVSEFTLSESRWIGLDINRVVTRGLLLDKVDLSKVDEIGFTTLMPGSGHGYGGYADVVSIEVYGIAVPRSGGPAPATAPGAPKTNVVATVGLPPPSQLASFANRSIAALVQDPQAHAIAQKLFAANCAACHGADGHGKSGVPNLAALHRQWGAGPEDIAASIGRGRGGLMPAWHDAMGQKGIEDVLAFTLTLSGRSLSEGDPVHGKEVFSTTCASCHGFDGKGNVQIGASDLTAQNWVYGGSVDTIRESIVNGRRGTMPAFGDGLGPTGVKLMAAYVLGLAASNVAH